jgi:hypothetical protein
MSSVAQTFGNLPKRGVKGAASPKSWDRTCGTTVGEQG